LTPQDSANETAMHPEEPRQPSAESSDTSQATRHDFDVRQLQTMAEDEADAEWLRHPEAWLMR